MFDEVELAHLLIGDFDSLGVAVWDQISGDGEAGLGCGRADEVEHAFQVAEGLAAEFLLIWLNKRCSIGFHLEVLGG